MPQQSVKLGFLGQFKLYPVYWQLLVMLGIGLVYYAIFCYGPMYGLQIAFKDYIFRLKITGSPWNNFANFKRMLSGSTFPQVFANTLIIGALKLAFGFPAPIILAILLNEVRHTAFKRTVQTISYLPHFISWVVLAGMFSQLLSPTTGAVNYILQRVTGKTINFMADPEWFRATVVATSIWKGVGWSSIIYLASLGSIDGELYEAAEIDGANRFRRVWHITLPGLLPIIMIQLILNVGSIINDDFDQIFNMYSVPVYSVGDVISTYTYREGLINRDYGFSTAVGLSKNVISFILIIVTNKITSRFTEYGVW